MDRRQLSGWTVVKLRRLARVADGVARSSQDRGRWNDAALWQARAIFLRDIADGDESHIETILEMRFLEGVALVEALELIGSGESYSGAPDSNDP